MFQYLGYMYPLAQGGRCTGFNQQVYVAATPSIFNA
jgi:hypothetical protein